MMFETQQEREDAGWNDETMGKLKTVCTERGRQRLSECHGYSAIAFKIRYETFWQANNFCVFNSPEELSLSIWQRDV